MAATLIRRRWSGAPLFTGDRSHLYDQLRDRGLSIWQVLGIAASAEVLFVALALVVDVIDSAVLASSVTSVAMGLILLLLHRGGFLRVA